MSKNRWENLSQCKDFEELKNNLSENTLDEFEKQLTEYLETENAPENLEDVTPRIVCWYTGLQTTQDIIDDYRE